MHRLITLGRLMLIPLLLLTLGSQVRAQSTLKIGIFDSDRTSSETAEGKRLLAELSAARDRKQQEISAMERTIQDLQQQLNEQRLSLSAEKRTALDMDIRRRLLELNNANDLAGKELQLEVAAAQARFNDKLEAVVVALGRDEQFDLILDRSVVAWAAPAIDVTTAIIDRFDRMFPAGGEAGGEPGGKP